MQADADLPDMYNFTREGDYFFVPFFSIYVNENSNNKHCCIYDNHKFFICRHNIEPPPFGDGSHRQINGPIKSYQRKILT